MRLLGIDLGGTFIKAAVLDLDVRQVMDVRRIAFPGFLPERVAGAREVDGDEIFKQVVNLIEEYCADYPDLSGLTLSSQMHSLVLCDSVGRLLIPPTTWQDMRSLFDGSFRALRELYTSDLSWEVGNECRAGHPVAVLHSLVKRGTPAITRSTVVTNLADWIIFRLTGAVQPIHVSQAAATGLWSLSGVWNERLLSSLGLGFLQMPDVVSESFAFNSAVLGRRWKIWPSVGDQQAALLGVDLQMGDLSVNVATGSQVSVLCRPSLIDRTSQCTVRPFFRGQMLATVTHLPAGRALNRWVATLSDLAQEAGMTVDECWQRLAEKAARVPIHSLPALDLSLFPCATGEYGNLTGLTENNLSAAQIFRSAIRSMALNYQWAGEILPNEPRYRILASGGLCQKNPILRDDIAELIGLPLILSPVVEDTLNGLMKYALAATH